MTLTETKIVDYLYSKWTSDAPGEITKTKPMNKSNKLWIKRNRLDVKPISAGLHQVVDYFEMRLSHPDKDAIDTLESYLRDLPGESGLEESFEDAAPDGWTYVNAERSDTVSTVGDYSVHIKALSGARAKYEVVNPWHFSFDVYVPDQENAQAYVPFYGPALACYFIFQPDYLGGAVNFNTYQLLSSWDVDTWYNVEMKKAHWETGLDLSHAEIYVDGVLKQEDALWEKVCTYFYLQTGSATHDCYFDNCIVNGGLSRAWKSPEILHDYLGKDALGNHVWTIRMYNWGIE